MQGNHFSLLQHETEKLRNDIEKMQSELRSGCVVMKSFFFFLPLIHCFVDIFLFRYELKGSVMLISDAGLKLIK